jgi:hypothetical protein
VPYLSPEQHRVGFGAEMNRSGVGLQVADPDIRVGRPLKGKDLILSAPETNMPAIR